MFLQSISARRATETSTYVDIFPGTRVPGREAGGRVPGRQHGNIRRVGWGPASKIMRVPVRAGTLRGQSLVTMPQRLQITYDSCFSCTLHSTPPDMPVTQKTPFLVVVLLCCVSVTRRERCPAGTTLATFPATPDDDDVVASTKQ